MTVQLNFIRSRTDPNFGKSSNFFFCIHATLKMELGGGVSRSDAKFQPSESLIYISTTYPNSSGNHPSCYYLIRQAWSHLISQPTSKKKSSQLRCLPVQHPWELGLHATLKCWLSTCNTYTRRKHIRSNEKNDSLCMYTCTSTQLQNMGKACVYMQVTQFCFTHQSRGGSVSRKVCKHHSTYTSCLAI